MGRIAIPRAFTGALVLAAFWALAGCSQQGFKVANLAKSDVNFVADASYRMCDERLRELAVKLYKRNPRELKKGLGRDAGARITQIFGTPGALNFPELEGHTGIDAMAVALEESYSGDRVFALMAGLVDMMRKSYNYRSDFYLIDSLDEDRLYKSARNLEILAWRLATYRDSRGRLLLLTNSREGEARNLSFERLLGELIAIQDLMAGVMAQKNDRLINKVTISMASMVFFPL